MLRLQKYIFVQEGKNRTLMQSGNHVAVRNVIIQFFGRPPPRIQVGYQKSQQKCQVFCQMVTKTTATYVSSTPQGRVSQH